MQNAEVQARLGKAINQLEQASRLLPKQAHLYYLLGRAYCMAGKYDLAVQVLPIFSELRPKNPQADLELGFALEKLCPPRGECEKITTKQVWQRAGVLPEHLIANGEAARKKEDFSQAIDWYRRAEAMGADLRSTIAFVRYQAALKEGREEEAYTALEEAVRTDTGWANADLRFFGWYRYGQWWYEKLGNFEISSEIMHQVIRMFPETPSSKFILSEAYRYIGYSNYYKGNFYDAIFYFNRALEIESKNGWAKIGLGKALYEKGNPNVNEIERIFLEALEFHSQNLSLWRDVIYFWKQKNQNDFFELTCEKAAQKEIVIDLCNG
ncbi:tetratricopeptide repeat protein [Bellilinea caldifistulae]|uniref:tetratricopeptide repeat protein n=1 Tax=Bellilinea caldifistulae TaxID=360411 RepID=UPI003D15FB59